MKVLIFVGIVSSILISLSTARGREECDNTLETLSGECWKKYGADIWNSEDPALLKEALQCLADAGDSAGAP